MVCSCHSRRGVGRAVLDGRALSTERSGRRLTRVRRRVDALCPRGGVAVCDVSAGVAGAGVLRGHPRRILACPAGRRGGCAGERSGVSGMADETRRSNGGPPRHAAGGHPAARYDVVRDAERSRLAANGHRDRGAARLVRPVIARPATLATVVGMVLPVDGHTRGLDAADATALRAGRRRGRGLRRARRAHLPGDAAPASRPRAREGRV